MANTDEHWKLSSTRRRQLAERVLTEMKNGNDRTAGRIMSLRDEYIVGTATSPVIEWEELWREVARNLPKEPLRERLPPSSSFPSGIVAMLAVIFMCLLMAVLT